MVKFFTQQSQALRVDREKRRIYGVAIATKGAANGDTFDDQTLKLIEQLGNADTIRARFDHPSRFDPREIEQSLDNLLGEFVSFRVDGDVVRADCHFAGVNLAKEDTILGLAEKTPHLFGVSVVIDEAPPAKGTKPKRGDPCRPVKLYATDYVDIPASNDAGLFAAKAAEGKVMDPLDMYAKDGKLFCQVDGKEFALNHNAETIAATKAIMKAEKQKDPEDEEGETEEAAAKKKSATKAEAKEKEPAGEVDVKKAVEEAVAGERKRRKAFGAILDAAGITDKEDIAELEEFYQDGMEEKQLKFLATRTIGARAKAIGEGSGKKDSQQKAPDETAKIEEAAGKRFDDEPSLRKSFGVTSSDPASDQWKSARGRYVASARRNYLDKK